MWIWKVPKTQIPSSISTILFWLCLKKPSQEPSTYQQTILPATQRQIWHRHKHNTGQGISNPYGMSVKLQSLLSWIWGSHVKPHCGPHTARQVCLTSVPNGATSNFCRAKQSKRGCSTTCSADSACRSSCNWQKASRILENRKCSPLSSGLQRHYQMAKKKPKRFQTCRASAPAAPESSSALNSKRRSKWKMRLKVQWKHSCLKKNQKNPKPWSNNFKKYYCVAAMKPYETQTDSFLYCVDNYIQEELEVFQGSTCSFFQ